MLEYLKNPIAQVILGLALLAGVFFAGTTISDKANNAKMKLLLSEIQSLKTEVVTVKMESIKVTQDLKNQRETTDKVLVEVQGLQVENKKLQTKVDKLAPLPDITKYTKDLPELQDCTPLLIQQREDFKAIEEPLRAEIASDRRVIDKQAQAIDEFKEERKKTDIVIEQKDKIIALQDKLEEKNTKAIGMLQEKVAIEETRKKRYRVAAITGWGAVLLILLL